MIKKIVKITLGIIVVLTVVGLYFLGSQIADGLARSNDTQDTQANSIKQLETWGFDYQAFEKTIATEKLTLVASDDTEIPLYALTQDMEKPAQGVVLLVHGLGGDYKSTYPQAQIYLKNNWIVYALDQRGSGASKDPIVSYGFYEKRDLERCVAYIRSKYDLPVVVHGISMGGATTGLYAGTEHANASIDGFILDASFDSMKGVFTPVWNEMETGLPVGFATAVGGVVTQMKYGFGFKDTDVSKALKSAEKPALLIWCEQDEIATEAMVQKNYNAIGHEQKEIVAFDSKHVEAVIDDPVAYETALLKFLKTIHE